MPFDTGLRNILSSGRTSFGRQATTQPKPKEKSAVEKLQEVAFKEAERKKKADEEAKKKKTAPPDASQGILSRMYKYWQGTDEKK